MAESTGEVVALISRSAPTRAPRSAVPLGQAREAFISFVGTSTAVFVGLALLAVVVLRGLVLRQILAMADTADRLSRGDWSTPELADAGSDELSELGTALAPRLGDRSRGRFPHAGADPFRHHHRTPLRRSRTKRCRHCVELERR